MTPAQLAEMPCEQLPQGRYPTSNSTVWVVSVLVALTGIMLGVVIPTALSADGGHDATQAVSTDEGVH